MGASGTADEAPGMKSGRLGPAMPDPEGTQHFHTRVPAPLGI